jgi:hypothetical protein
MTAILHGLFTLAEGVSEAEFVPAFEAFYQHLHEQGYVRSLSIGVQFWHRGRDAHYCAPPAQNRTGPIKAYGSHLG